MRRRTYILIILLLSLIRIYFALSPSYLHPDENFQGPEIIAGTSLPPLSHPHNPDSRADTNHLRRRILVPRPQNLGIHSFESHSQFFPAMARVRVPHVPPPLALGRFGV